MKQNGEVTSQTEPKPARVSITEPAPTPTRDGEVIRDKLHRYKSEPVGSASWKAPSSNKCAVCDKVVYAMEKLEVDKTIYHKVCFKCSVCKKTLR